MNLKDCPHNRFNPLTNEWILVSPHRAQRPWQGKVEKSAPDRRPAYDPACYLCPGNSRVGGSRNPAYENTFVFDNDFQALLADIPADSMNEGQLLVAHSERGLCRVICFSPRHDVTLALMDQSDIVKVVEVWTAQYKELCAIDFISYIQIFENRGDLMGCSNPHPHGQIWCNEHVPVIPAAETASQREYLHKNGRCLLCDYAALERARGERIIFENNNFIALVPFWASWPFETMLLPKFHAADIAGLSPEQKNDFADALRRMGIRFDNLFATNFPYSMGIHQRPCDTEAHDEWHFHLHYLPPLLRSAAIRKFMVGYELLAMPQRDITAEESARRLAACSETHYTKE
ncbi:MAG: UDP-glucose--hexose-1-phosphate uridylyltransferase [Chitinivibrionales bacterium]|nr:UDP-glucose--hexose-1-phosphate uridylyltransferase [Chitinivibrionales bacterium]